MQAVFLLVTIPLSLAAWTAPPCGFRIVSGIPYQGKYCYLNAGHLADNQQNVYADRHRHNLDHYNEYNVFWQCTYTADRDTHPPVWKFERGTSGNRLYTMMPDRGNRIRPFYLEADPHEGGGLTVSYHEFNAKVDPYGKPEAKIGLYYSGTPNQYLLGYQHHYDSLNGDRWIILQRDIRRFYFELVSDGTRVVGFDAMWEFYANDNDYLQKIDNYVKLIPASCAADVDPIPDSEPNPSSIYIQLPSQTFTYIVGLLFVLVIVNFICCIYSNKSGKLQYKGVKNYDSETDAV